MQVNKVLKEITQFTKRNANTILTIASGIGLVGSMVLVAKETPLAIDRLRQAEMDKDDELTTLETTIVAASAYIPAIVVGASTLVCIVSCGVLNAKRQNQLVALCTLANNSYREYREKLIELKGEELDREIIAEVTRSRSNYQLANDDESDAKVIWYDPISKQYFSRFEREIIDAEYQLNRIFALRGYASVNDLYEALGLRLTTKGAILGWTIEDGVYWIDFEHTKQEMQDGSTCYSINTIFEPSESFVY